MKISCGTDIIEIARIKESIEDNKIGKAFVERVYTQKEIEYCESKKIQKYQHYAVRFAAKEAAFKAVSNLLEDKFSITWKNFEVINDEQGRPRLNIIGINLDNIENIDLSMSHCKEYAVANVTLLRN
ncbi:MAG: holo-ACP synthase [Clostridia bacterium]|nr:holo-ACP synthase [Clostridia bacterium]